jgi:hypothetical protein
MQSFVSRFGPATIAILVFTCAQGASSQTLRYTVTANVPGIVWDTAIPNCMMNECLITITGVGNAASADPFPLVCVGGGTACTGKGSGGAGNLNRSLTNATVTVYDPIAGVTYGPAALPRTFYTSVDNFNGGIGFGADSYGNPAFPVSGGPAYPASIGFLGGPSEYDVYGIDPFYDLRYPLIAGGPFNNCPTGGLGCVNIPPPVPQPAIPVTLPDGTTVSLSVAVPLTSGFVGQYWVQEEPPSNEWTAASPMGQARYGTPRPCFLVERCWWLAAPEAPRPQRRLRFTTPSPTPGPQHPRRRAAARVTPRRCWLTGEFSS